MRNISTDLPWCRSYAACRENEKCQDLLLDCKLGRGRQLSEKEHVKLQAKRKKSETAVRKSDMEYYAACIKVTNMGVNLSLENNNENN